MRPPPLGLRCRWWLLVALAVAYAAAADETDAPDLDDDAEVCFVDPPWIGLAGSGCTPYNPVLCNLDETACCPNATSISCAPEHDGICATQACPECGVCVMPTCANNYTDDLCDDGFEYRLSPENIVCSHGCNNTVCCVQETMAPATAAPPTSAPPTSAPPTAAPPTDVPPTPEPPEPTDSPTTDVPKTSPPPTEEPCLPDVVETCVYYKLPNRSCDFAKLIATIPECPQKQLRCMLDLACSDAYHGQCARSFCETPAPIPTPAPPTRAPDTPGPLWPFEDCYPGYERVDSFNVGVQNYTCDLAFPDNREPCYYDDVHQAYAACEARDDCCVIVQKEGETRVRIGACGDAYKLKENYATCKRPPPPSLQKDGCPAGYKLVPGSAAGISYKYLCDSSNSTDFCSLPAESAFATCGADSRCCSVTQHLGDRYYRLGECPYAAVDLEFSLTCYKHVEPHAAGESRWQKLKGLWITMITVASLAVVGLVFYYGRRWRNSPDEEVRTLRSEWKMTDLLDSPELPMESLVRCTMCAAISPSDTLFCTSCGQDLRDSAAVDTTNHSRLMGSLGTKDVLMASVRQAFRRSNV
ncbi:hypothetical protein DIPPA_14501 [Diplonema papillatum]|nr:hypothetical protein DIPPA_14501 [Diplonema papillatum]